MPYLFERRPDGVLYCTMPEPAARAAAVVAGQLRQMIEGSAPAGDAIVERLFPRAYLDPTEEEAEREWEALAHPDLARGKLEALTLVGVMLRDAQVSDGLVAVRVLDEEAEVWLTALNDMRLALGTRLGVTEDHDPDDLDPDAPDAPWWFLYYFLTECQGVLIELLIGEAQDQAGSE